MLLTGLAGLLAGALSMGAGEYVSVRSQRELLEASRPGRGRSAALPQLDVDANELALVYRARGMEPDEAQARADEVLGALAPGRGWPPEADGRGRARGGRHRLGRRRVELLLLRLGGRGAGAAVPVRARRADRGGVRRGAGGLALLATGATVGVLSGASPLKRGVRQLGIGYGAAGCDLPAGLAFGATV